MLLQYLRQTIARPLSICFLPNYACRDNSHERINTNISRRNYSDVSKGTRRRVDWRGAADRRVVITGFGMTTPLGVGVAASWRRLLDGQSGIRSLRDRPGFDRLPSQVAAWLPESELNLSDHFSAVERRQMSTSCLHALLVSDEVMRSAEYSTGSDPIEQQNTGTIIGAGMCDLQAVAETGAKFELERYRAIGPQLVTRALINSAAGLVSIRHRLRGPNSAPSTACTTGLHAIGDAYQSIRIGRAERIVAGGVDCSLNPLVVAAFCRLRALSTFFNDHPSQASRPFDRQRDGFVLGEGCGLLMVESLSSAKARSARIHAEILGYGMSADAHHMTAPSPEGIGAFDCMQQALHEANLKPNQVGHVNCHSTSTPLGDQIELSAIRRLFGLHSSNVWVTSNKGAIGHLLGAAGSVEAIFTVLSVRDGCIAPTLNLVDPVEGHLRYVRHKSSEWTTEEGQQRRVALTNSFGFGGTNASLVIAEYKD